MQTKTSTKANGERDFEREHKELMEKATFIPPVEWRGPGDSFKILTFYNDHTPVKPSTSTKLINL